DFRAPIFRIVPRFRRTNGGDRIGPAMSRPLAVILAFAAFQAATLRAQDRMPPIAPEKMTDAQKKAVQEYEQIRNQDLTGPPWSCGPRTSWSRRSNCGYTTRETARSARSSRNSPS